jgi:hypothetical protein
LITWRLVDRARFVCLDTLTGGPYLEEDNDVQACELAWKRLSATALDFDRSVALTERIAGEHRSGHGKQSRRVHVAKEQP